MEASKKKRVKAVITGAILLAVLAFCLVYTRPLTIEERFPMLEMSECTRIKGYYSNGQAAEESSFVIYPEDPCFSEMIALFEAPAFHTRLKNLLPMGTRIHRAEEGDFEWELIFRFEDVRFPSGDMGRGDMLHIRNFFGDLTLHFDGESTRCSVKEQEQGLRDVMDRITNTVIEQEAA